MPTFSCPIVGTFEPMKDFLLPQKVDVLKDFYFRRYCSGLVTPQATPKNVHIDEVLDRLLHIYEVSTIIEREGDYYKNCISKRAMSQAFNRLIDNVEKLRKRFKKTAIPSEKVKTDRDVLVNSLHSIFPVVKSELHIPAYEKEFYQDQCTVRKRYRSGVDKKRTKELNNRIDRKSTTEASLKRRKLSESQPPPTTDSASIASTASSSIMTSASIASTASSMSSAARSNYSDDEPIVKTPKAKVYNTTPLSTVARVLAHAGLSNEIGAKILTAHSVDKGDGLVYTAKKVAGAREAARAEEFEHLKGRAIHALYTDGRADFTLTKSSIHPSGTETAKITHDTITTYGPTDPGGAWYGFTTPESGTGAHISDSLVEYLATLQADLDHLTTFGSDGANNMAGWENGAGKHFENALKRPLQRVVCLFHENELPLRALFCYLDGSTQGPFSFEGPIGKLCAEALHKFAVSKNLIPLPIPDFPLLSSTTLKSLSTDQKYLYKICAAVIEGKVPKSLADLKIGKLAHSRWTTLASRIMRLLVTLEPNSPHYSTCRTLATYICGVYYKTFNSIKVHPNITDGPLHLYNQVQNMKLHFHGHRNKDILKLLLNTVQTNCYFAHPENILIAMLASQNKDARSQAIKIIMNVRSFPSDYVYTVRPFYRPEIQTDADMFSRMSKVRTDKRTGQFKFLTKSHGWMNITEPPLTIQLSSEEIHAFKDTPLVCTYPCHTQATERGVKLTTESVSRITKKERQIGEGLSKLKSCAMFKGERGRVCRKYFKPKNIFKD